MSGNIFESSWTHYFPAEGLGCNNIKVVLYYHLGGMNQFTYKTETRGYYISVTPVCRERKYGCNVETVTLGTGVKQLVLPVSRKSDKSANKAQELANDGRLNYLIKYVCDKYGIRMVDTNAED